MAARSKAKVYGRSPAEIVGSNPTGSWMFVVSVVCCLCDGLITHPEESYQLWRVVVCDQETSRMRRLKPATGAVENTTTMGCNSRKTNNKQRECLVAFIKKKFVTMHRNMNVT